MSRVLREWKLCRAREQYLYRARIADRLLRAAENNRRDAANAEYMGELEIILADATARVTQISKYIKES
jgi:hypothetical protein